MKQAFGGKAVALEAELIVGTEHGKECIEHVLGYISLLCHGDELFICGVSQCYGMTCHFVYGGKHVLCRKIVGSAKVISPVVIRLPIATSAAMAA